MKTVVIAAAALLTASVSHAQNTYHMRDFYPQAWDKVYIFGQPGSVERSAVVVDRWSDSDAHDGDFTFTMHRIFFREGEDWRTRWCPRIDDVKRWVGGKLHYSETLDFYKGIHTRISPQGQLWADEAMTVGTVSRQTGVRHAAWDFEHTNCAEVQHTTPIHDVAVTFWRALAVEATDWSPYTDRGQERRPVPVVRLDETTCWTESCDAQFKEEWFFAYEESVLGYVPIHTKGYSLELGQPLEVLWDLRLLAVEPRARPWAVGLAPRP